MILRELIGFRGRDGYWGDRTETNTVSFPGLYVGDADYARFNHTDIQVKCPADTGVLLYTPKSYWADWFAYYQIAGVEYAPYTQVYAPYRILGATEELVCAASAKVWLFYWVPTLRDVARWQCIQFSEALVIDNTTAGGMLHGTWKLLATYSAPKTPAPNFSVRFFWYCRYYNMPVRMWMVAEVTQIAPPAAAQFYWYRGPIVTAVLRADVGWIDLETTYTGDSGTDPEFWGDPDHHAADPYSVIKTKYAGTTNPAWW